MEVFRLYPQFNNKDRRQQNVPVAIDRRSNIDRRTKFTSDSDIKERRIDPKLRKDIEQVKDVFKAFHNDASVEHDIEVGAASSIPYIRRLRGINDAICDNDYIKATGTAILLFINVKEDWRDITKIFKKNNIPSDFQVPFSFTRGTPLEKYEALSKIDKTLERTIIGKRILNKLGIDDFQIFFDNKFDKHGRPIMAYKAKSRILQGIIARSFLRIPVLSLVFLSLLEVPSVIKEKEHCKQAIKSAISVTSVVIGGALFGALGAYLGPLGSLAGLGVGSYYAGRLAKKINSRLLEN